MEFIVYHYRKVSFKISIVLQISEWIINYVSVIKIKGASEAVFP